jgi:hypothetical protein
MTPGLSPALPRLLQRAMVVPAMRVSRSLAGTPALQMSANGNLRRELRRIPFVRGAGAEAQEAGPHDAGLKPGSSTAASTDDGSAGDAGITVAGGDARAPVNPRETLPRSAQTMWAGKVLG